MDLRKYIDEILETRAKHAATDFSIPETTPPTVNLSKKYKLQWKTGDLPISSERLIDLVELRNKLPGYLEQADGTTILTLPPGSGKTYAMLEYVQSLAKDGKRVLVLGHRHELFYDLRNHDIFEEELWHHWQPISPDTCVRCPLMKIWQFKGYSTIDLCNQLCDLNSCSYRLQAKTKKMLVFAMHQHLIYGLAITDFDLVIIDESPLSVFIQQRTIPRTGIIPKSLKKTTKLYELLLKLVTLSIHKQMEPIGGYNLMAQIHELLGDVFAEIELWQKDVMPIIPILENPETDIEKLDYFYIFDLLKILSEAYERYQQGQQYWQPKVILSHAGLSLHWKASLWSKLPERKIILDATGNEKIYQHLFTEDLVIVNSQVARRGKIRQITGRLNGKAQLIKDKKPTPQAETEILAIQALISRFGYQKTGIITHKGLAGLISEKLPKSEFLNFFGQRGTNSMQHCDAVFVLGTPSPPNWSILRTTSLLFNPIVPYLQSDDPDELRELYSQELRSYAITPRLYRDHDEQIPHRLIKGYWNHDDLQIIYSSFRESELIQAIHRGRPISRLVDVWILTSTPVSIALDEIYEQPPIAPTGIKWRIWVEKIAPFLDSCHEQGKAIGYKELAEHLSYSDMYLRRQKWLFKIREWQPTRWIFEDDLNYSDGGGAKVQRLKPVEV